jgi:two-component system phosphate regulon sensor histidine kinase PhoR
MLKILFIIIIISFAVSFFISKSLANPIKYLVHASQSVASGNFMTKIELKSMDEFRDLAESFNYMTSKINDLFRQLSLEEEELGIIISSIQEGLVALDKEGRILLFNESFAQMMGRGRDFRGKYYWEALRNEDFINSVHQIMKRENDINSAQLPVEIILDQRFYHLGISYIESKEEYVIIFHDITELRKLECIKKDFVTNVSHELRTPLTAIKGFSETLHAKEENAAKKHYLEIILRHTDRLILIVQDLLLLSRLEEKKLALDVEELDISKVIHNALKLFEKKIVKKNLKLDIVFEKKLPRIQGDLGKLEQLFINLIDNAIKYTDKGRIRIETARAEGGVSIVLEDSGIGIPQDMQERVFERFFVVDKSRSRKQGSTGLGLAIVKHIVNLHHGSIGVKSQLNKGTALSIYLPQQQVQAGDTNG